MRTSARCSTRPGRSNATSSPASSSCPTTCSCGKRSRRSRRPRCTRSRRSRSVPRPASTSRSRSWPRRCRSPPRPTTATTWRAWTQYRPTWRAWSNSCAKGCAPAGWRRRWPCAACRPSSGSCARTRSTARSASRSARSRPASTSRCATPSPWPVPPRCATGWRRRCRSWKNSSAPSTCRRRATPSRPARCQPAPITTCWR